MAKESDFQSKICSVDECGQSAFCKGLCRAHYMEEAVIGRDNKLKEWRLV